MLAGNVTAAMVGGNLVISGDDNHNNIEVVGTGVPGEFRVIGLDLAGATLINGGGRAGDISRRDGRDFDQRSRRQ